MLAALGLARGGSAPKISSSTTKATPSAGRIVPSPSGPTQMRGARSARRSSASAAETGPRGAAVREQLAEPIGLQLAARDEHHRDACSRRSEPRAGASALPLGRAAWSAAARSAWSSAATDAVRAPADVYTAQARAALGASTAVRPSVSTARARAGVERGVVQVERRERKVGRALQRARVGGGALELVAHGAGEPRGPLEHHPLERGEVIEERREGVEVGREEAVGAEERAPGGRVLHQAAGLRRGVVDGLGGVDEPRTRARRPLRIEGRLPHRGKHEARQEHVAVRLGGALGVGVERTDARHGSP